MAKQFLLCAHSFVLTCFQYLRNAVKLSPTDGTGHEGAEIGRVGLETIGRLAALAVAATMVVAVVVGDYYYCRHDYDDDNKIIILRQS
jgi:hypothetical protein